MTQKLDLIGKTFGNLKVLNYVKSNKDGKSIWLAECSCGKIFEVLGTKLKKITACGDCRYKSFKRHKKYDYHIASAKHIWLHYADNNELTLEKFVELSGKNCYYCDSAPKNLFNKFKNSNLELSKKLGEFKYNGLDRLDNSKKHTLENVVTCCKDCNRIKHNRNYNQFIDFINNFKFTNPKDYIIPDIKYPQDWVKISVHLIKMNKYSEMDSDLFYTLSQEDCFYCGISKDNSNKHKLKNTTKYYKEKNYIFNYNGIDRIDSNLKHIAGNIVPCCFNCNFAKNTRSINDFYDHIKKIKDHQNKETGQNDLSL